MPRAIRIHQTGGPEVLQWEEIEVGAPGPGQVRLKQSAVGLNLHRCLSPHRPLPAAAAFRTGHGRQREPSMRSGTA